MADVVVTMESDVAKYLRDLERLVQKQQSQIDKLRETSRTAKQTGDTFTKSGKQADDAFGTRLVAKLQSANVAMEVIQGTARLIGDAFAFVREETDKATRSFDDLADANRRLVQVARSAEDLEELNRRADELAQRFGADRITARNVVFEARSAGFEGFVEDIFLNRGVVDPLAAAQVSAKIPSLFGGRISSRQAVNAVLAAAERSQEDFESIAAATPGTAEGAAQTGTGAVETFTLLSVLAGQFESGRVAGNRLKALGQKLALSERFSGKGIIGGVRELIAASEEDRREFLGTSQEVNPAFNAVSNSLRQLDEMLPQVQREFELAGTSESALTRKRLARETEETETGRRFLAQRERERSERELEISRERQLAESGFAVDAAINRQVQRGLERGGLIGNLQAFGAERLAIPGLPDVGTVARSTGNETAATIVSLIGQHIATEGIVPFQTIERAANALERAAGRFNSGGEFAPNARAQQSQQTE